MESLVRRVHGVRRSVALAVLLAVVPLHATGCFGTFQLTRKVYDFNRTVSHDRWIRWIFFLVMIVVPVYGFAAVVDAVFANPIEFWGGRNPINADAGTTRTVRDAEGRQVTATKRADGILRLELSDADGGHWVVDLVETEDGLAARDATGTVRARLDAASGVPQLVRMAAAR
jgi:hypothetical protein